MQLLKKIDRPFFIIVLLLVGAGFFIFSSASLGLLARDGAQFSNVAFSQLFFGILLGAVAMIVMSNIKYRVWRKYALYIFLFSIFLMLLVFVPGVGFEYGGARRWIHILNFSFQPAEALKLGFVLYFAAWLSNSKDRIHTFWYGLAPLLALLGITGGLLLAQPDTGTFLVLVSAGLGMYIAAGARWRDLALVGGGAVALVGLLAIFRPYVRARILTFLDPSSDPLGAGYQIQQALIAIGSGQWFGRGFGQSVQKFNYLPEPIGDSVFAVAAEEFGFIGAVIIIGLFVAFALRGLSLASRTNDQFGGLLIVGLVILVISQSFINIGAMLGVLPLTGIPLLFVSHGGTALLIALAEVGIILNVSKYLQS